MSALTNEATAMVTIIDMTTGEVQHPMAEPVNDAYNMEVLCAGWNPAVDTLAAQLALQTVSTEQSARGLPPDLAEMPLDAFIEVMQGR